MRWGAARMGKPAKDAKHANGLNRNGSFVFLGEFCGQSYGFPVPARDGEIKSRAYHP